ncbi:hypothetical protein KAR91_27960 [Candidatus Pacearchaeota archaeon]|nr:hypothetical protein [Candidatus Pacearchaeota archaeon]
MKNVCKSDDGRCPLAQRNDALKIIHQRVRNTPVADRAIVEGYDERNIVRCLDFCHVFGRPPNVAHHGAWQNVFVMDHGIYKGILDTNEAYLDFMSNGVLIENLGVSITGRERYECWYADRYVGGDVLSLLEDSRVYIFAKERVNQAQGIALKLGFEGESAIKRAVENLGFG